VDLLWSGYAVLLQHRGDYLEETYYSFSYTQIYDEPGGGGGTILALKRYHPQSSRSPAVAYGAAGYFGRSFVYAEFLKLGPVVNAPLTRNA
jgi:hypothetical protein